MSISTRSHASERTEQSARRGASQSDRHNDAQLTRWGGVAGVAGAGLLISSALVVGVLGLPDASDVETLTDFANIETGRIVEHFLYLGALMGFALHLFVLGRLLWNSHPAAALFGTVVAGFGFLTMAASSLLHVSTSPLAELYTDPGATPEDLQAIESAWFGAQSVFDTMLLTGVLLVPIGIVFLGIAMQRTPLFGTRLTGLTFALGFSGIIGATIAVIDPDSLFAAVSLLAIAVFHLATGWRTFKLANESTVDITDTRVDVSAIT
ncbi:MAG: hypothetical protein KJO18_06730 [Acidimicrobiia bacterium]|nr:hypothetical protein [Acidimicrobiia bacterium]